MLQAQLNDAQKDLVKLQTDLNSLIVTSTNLQQQIDSKMKDATAAQTIITSYPNVIQKQTNDLAAYKNQTDANPTLINQLEVKLMKLKNDLSKAKTNLPKLNLDIANLKQQKTKNDKTAQQKQNDVQSKIAQIADLQQKVAAAQPTKAVDNIITPTTKVTDTVATSTKKTDSILTVSLVLANPNPAYDLMISPTVIAVIRESNPDLRTNDWKLPIPDSIKSRSSSEPYIYANALIIPANDLAGTIKKVRNQLNQTSNVTKKDALYALITSGAPYYAAIVNSYDSDPTVVSVLQKRGDWAGNMKTIHATIDDYVSLITQIQALS